MTFPRLVRQALQLCVWPNCQIFVDPDVGRCFAHRWHRVKELARLWGES